VSIIDYYFTVLLITILQLTNRSAIVTVKLPFIQLKQHFRFCCLKESLKKVTVTVAWAGIFKLCTPVKFGRTVLYPLHASQVWWDSFISPARQSSLVGQFYIPCTPVKFGRTVLYPLHASQVWWNSFISPARQSSLVEQFYIPCTPVKFCGTVLYPLHASHVWWDSFRSPAREYKFTTVVLWLTRNNVIFRQNKIICTSKYTSAGAKHYILSVDLTYGVTLSVVMKISCPGHYSNKMF